jgi:5-methylcytosine-specific restriction endonuclease McrA
MSYKEDYAKFLKSEYWAKVRKKILARDNNQCGFCGSKKRLEIHHYTYKNHLDELNHLDDLVALCHNCHSNVDYIMQEANEEIEHFKQWCYDKMMSEP